MQCAVADDADIRRENFRKLWGSPFSPSEAAVRLWGTAAQWSDLYHGRKSFGEKLARKIEDALGLPRLSLDDPGGLALSPIPPDVLSALQDAPADVRQQAETILRALLKIAAPDDGTNGKRRALGA
jgi:hypothetical protein